MCSTSVRKPRGKRGLPRVPYGRGGAFAWDRCSDVSDVVLRSALFSDQASRGLRDSYLFFSLPPPMDPKLGTPLSSVIVPAALVHCPMLDIIHDTCDVPVAVKR